MSIFKCKMCGGDLEIADGVTITECEYCGTKQTVPKAMDENLQNLFNRANTLRIKSEFDKAEKLYEKIIQADTTQSEAYWGLILCKYGIEYVDDPATFKKIPTCHRASYDSIIADDDYKSAIENADLSQRAIYEEQAKEIDRIQKEILVLAPKKETYDVFICYKETDADGHRTQDSVIANDIYYQLTQEGFKVFYAAITLEGKLGSAYEPIIFAALNSAKVMLSIGTKPEYFNAVWVKNEWSRFLKIIKKDRSKLLIPCYRDMDAYELPEEFSHLQAQDMSKLGFMQDLIRGIKKIAKSDEPKITTVVKETVVTSANTNVAPLLKRAFMFLEDGDWDRADDFCEQVLNQDPENAQAYLGKLMVELKVKKQDELKDCDKPFDNSNNYQKALRFADEKLKSALNDYFAAANEKQTQKQIVAQRRKKKQKKTFIIIASAVVALVLAFVFVVRPFYGLLTGDYKIYIKTYNIKKFKIPEGTVEIGAYAFENCTSLTSVTIPDSVTSIGSDAFVRCFSLTNITIPDSVTSIGDSAFANCYSLTSVTIGNSVTSIGPAAFQDCTSLTSVTLGNGVTSVGAWAFHNCTSLTGITIPNSVTSIGDSAFQNCDGLTSITIPDSVTSIGNSTFQSCNSLVSITIPNSVTSIGDEAFYNCTSLKNITIPDSVTSIGDYAFRDCTSLKNIKFDGTVAQWKAIKFGTDWRKDGPVARVICSDGTVTLK